MVSSETALILSYRDRPFIVAEYHRVVKPKCKQFTSRNQMLSNFSKVLIVHISFTTLKNNEGVRKASVAFERHQEELNLRFVIAENNRVLKPKFYQVILR